MRKGKLTTAQKRAVVKNLCGSQRTFEGENENVHTTPHMFIGLSTEMSHK